MLLLKVLVAFNKRGLRYASSTREDYSCTPVTQIERSVSYSGLETRPSPTYAGIPTMDFNSLSATGDIENIDQDFIQEQPNNSLNKL